MTEDTPEDRDIQDASISNRAAVATAVSSTYKVLGEFTAADGAGVLGKNDAGSGTPIGVEGAIPNSTEGYGLATPDDTRIDGGIDTTGAHRLRVDGDLMLFIGSKTSGAMGNIIGGQNAVNSNAVGVTISGGGFDDGSTNDLNVVADDFGTVGGGRANQAGSTDDDTTTAKYATVGGGYENEATGEFATVAGGGPGDTANPASTNNRAVNDACTVGGGLENRAGDSADQLTTGATVAGGRDNVATGQQSTVCGGSSNEASGFQSFVGGGRRNFATADRATIPGGRNNHARGLYSFAAGRLANADHAGSFVFGDSTSTKVSSGGSDEARFQMAVYAPSFNTTSARAAKTGIDPIDPADVLEGVQSLEVGTWELRDREDGRHIGPMAGEFAETFDLGNGHESIATVDADGVALAAIQGLAQRLDETANRIDEQADRIDDLESENEQLRERHATLEERLAALEERVAGMEAGQASPATADD